MLTIWDWVKFIIKALIGLAVATYGLLWLLDKMATTAEKSGPEADNVPSAEQQMKPPKRPRPKW